MPRKCTECELPVKSEGSIKCNSCKESIHYACSELPPYAIAFLERIGKFSCDDCVRDQIGEKELRIIEVEIKNQEEIEKKNRAVMKNAPKAAGDASPEKVSPGTPGENTFTKEKVSCSKQTTHLETTKTPLTEEKILNQNESFIEQRLEIIDKMKTRNKPTPQRICKYYLRGLCKHGRVGRRCKFQHPKLCHFTHKKRVPE